MESVPKPTILDCIELWHWLYCRGCGEPITDRWIPNDSQEDPSSAPAEIYQFRCKSCAVQAAPAEEREQLTAIFQRMSRVRGYLALEMLPRLRGITPTVSLFRYRGRGRSSSAFVEEYTVEGTIYPMLADGFDRYQVTTAPQFHFNLDPPHATINVVLATIVCFPHDPETEIRFFWNRFQPSAPSFMTVYGWNHHSPEAIGALVKEAMEQFRLRDPGGRTALVKQQEEVKLALLALADRWVTEHAYAPHNAQEFATFAGIGVSTLHYRLKAADLDPWSEFRKRYLSGRRISRKARTITR